MTFLFALICSSLLIFLLHSMIRNPRFYRTFRLDSIQMLAGMIVLRLFFPFEFSFARTVYLPSLSSDVQPAMAAFVGSWTGGLLPLLWGIGSIAALGYYLVSLLFADKQMRLIRRTKKAKGSRDGFEIACSDLVSCPFIAGKTIYLPATLNLSAEELDAIVRHEKAHYKNRHYFLKYILILLKAVYWWLLPVYLLEQDVRMYFELKADYEAAKGLSEADYLQYAETVLSVQRKCGKPKTRLHPASSFVRSKNETASRIRFFLSGEDKPKTNRLLLTLFAFVLLIPSILILKPDILPPGLGTEIFTEEQITPVEIDGKFYLQLGDEMVEIDNDELKEQFFKNENRMD